ncbi:MAG: dockerin type I repeat-containing protein [Planctomycetota bacterium]
MSRPVLTSPVLTPMVSTIVVLVLSTLAHCQPNPNHVLGFESGVAGSGGGSATITCTYNNTSTSVIEGWSFGVCHDVTDLTPTAVAAGLTTQTVKNGSPPDFIQMNFSATGTTTPVVSTAGVNQAVVICFTGCAALPPGSSYQLMDNTYSLIGPDGPTPLTYCNTTLGGALVSTVIVVQGQSVTPTILPGSIEIGGIEIPTLRAPTGLSVAPGASVDAPITLVHNAVNVYGFSFGLTHTATVATLTGISAGAATLAADYFQADITPVSGAGGIVGCVLDFGPTSPLGFIPQGPLSEIAVFEYQVLASAPDAATSPLTFSGSLVPVLPSPPTPILISMGEEGIVPTLQAGLITVDGGPPVVEFIRGDANVDGALNIADPVFMLNYLFASGPIPTCLKTVDCNDDGALNIADPVYSLNYQFAGGPIFPAPFGSGAAGCGVDPTADSLTCLGFTFCL